MEQTFRVFPSSWRNTDTYRMSSVLGAVAIPLINKFEVAAAVLRRMHLPSAVNEGFFLV